MIPFGTWLSITLYANELFFLSLVSGVISGGASGAVIQYIRHPTRIRRNADATDATDATDEGSMLIADYNADMEFIF